MRLSEQMSRDLYYSLAIVRYCTYLVFFDATNSLADWTFLLGKLYPPRKSLGVLGVLGVTERDSNNKIKSA